MSQRGIYSSSFIHQDEVGEVVVKQTHDRPVILEGYSRPEFSYVTLAADGLVALDVTDAVLLVVRSRDNVFSFKLANTDAAQLDNMKSVELVGNDPSDASLGAGVAPVLIGNGSTVASLEVWIVRE
jgi:hypothetical protein